jgi:hypothetical protein
MQANQKKVNHNPESDKATTNIGRKSGMTPKE